ncbi:MAG TPA: helix-turn-helix transcriptional regulator [Thermoleophilia bacterium]|nr:helix-turn-helix transcriptional regulator [Thermoleophilia bacterium]
MDASERLAQNIRRRRKEMGISQEALGERCGLHRTEISLLERAARDPRLSTLVRVARALRLDLAEMLQGIR